eukprot:6942648-Alexandrium_andersonii.AAC.1
MPEPMRRLHRLLSVTLDLRVQQEALGEDEASSAFPTGRCCVCGQVAAGAQTMSPHCPVCDQCWHDDCQIGTLDGLDPTGGLPNGPAAATGPWADADDQGDQDEGAHRGSHGILKPSEMLRDMGRAVASLSQSFAFAVCNVRLPLPVL